MGAEYIDVRARELADGKSSPCRRATEKALQEVKKRLAEGRYGARNEPLEDLEFIISHDPACRKRKRALASAVKKRSEKNRSK